jgi:hypothetical protein
LKKKTKCRLPSFISSPLKVPVHVALSLSKMCASRVAVAAIADKAQPTPAFSFPLFISVGATTV